MSDHEAPELPPEVEQSTPAEPLPTQEDPDLVNVTEKGSWPSKLEIRLAGRRKS
jgi:hypothetical protein